jgi:monofunctional biosynthetic peptidoglycan transglycosylase
LSGGVRVFIKIAMDDLRSDPDMAAAPVATKGGGGRARRIWRRCLRLLVVAFGLSVMLTAVYRFAPVPLTPLMVLRLFEGEGFSKDWVAYEEISPNLPRAVIAAEDAGFCQHWGFDFEAIQKALAHNEDSRRLRGGSTISNQTAKNVFLWPGDSRITRYARKAVEPYFTLLIEAMWGKKRILEVYLNVVEWGPGIYGAEAAAQHHFNKPASKLTRREAALLAAALPSPRRYNAGKPGNYVSRQANAIQRRMNDVPDPTETPCPRS